MKKVRLAFCGAGSMGQMAHLINYAELPEECELVAVSDAVPGKAAAVARRYGVAHAYESDAALLERHADGIDAIVAMRPFVLHRQVLPPIIATGKPFIVEKPLSSSVTGGRELLEAIHRHGSRCMVAYHKRSDPATGFAKARIDEFKTSGELGKLRLVKAIMPPGDWIAGGFAGLIAGAAPFAALAADPGDPQYDAGQYDRYIEFVNFYIHQVNLLRHLLGEAYHFEYVAPNRALAAGRSVSGVCCTLEMAPYSSSVEWHEEAWACFEHGYVKIELPAPLARYRAGRASVYRDPGNGVTPTLEMPELPMCHAMRRQAENFLRFARGEAPAPADAAEALLDLENAAEYLQLTSE